MKPTHIILFSLLILSLSACQSTPESDPAYVSPTQYSDYSCSQIKAEMSRVSLKLEQAVETDQTKQVLGTAITIFAISQGYGVSRKEDIALRRLQNQYDVLEQTAIRKDCKL